ncbi:GreA/GreB family elongation factor [Pseudonocardia sp. C8]|uniref:GreA/GreB family elongation factor n=1 Tax=Pseudonocardia sp. C8 TaxID=2762759 RepID=UPI0016427C2B|nr:GreA/GreB family elongation factor [Pseudonocardia sp. C8]MBC3191912.1 GreA/GreB family elongation factor [Pseudonocardia sp. C8]
MATADDHGVPEHETWAPDARIELERTLARLREQRAQLAPAGPEDTAGDYGDHAQALELDDDLSMLDRRIHEIEELLARGPQAAGSGRGDTVPDGDALPDGTEVTLRFADGGTETVRVVTAVEAVSDDDRARVVTPDSPLGRALRTGRVGDVVTYPTPEGTGRAELLRVRLPGDPPDRA